MSNPRISHFSQTPPAIVRSCHTCTRKIVIWVLINRMRPCTYKWFIFGARRCEQMARFLGWSPSFPRSFECPNLDGHDACVRPAGRCRKIFSSTCHQLALLGDSASRCFLGNLDWSPQGMEIPGSCEDHYREHEILCATTGLGKCSSHVD